GSDFLSTHPMGPQRVAAALLSARQWGSRGIGETDRDSYLRLLDGLIYGDDPAQGLVRGQRFLHPYFGFAFAAPEGFTLENTNQAVVGIAPDERALRFDKLAKAEGSLQDVLRASAARDLNIEKIEPLSINGFEAATALGRSPGWTFRIVLIRKDSEVYRFIFVSRKFNEQADALFLSAAHSFHALAEDEKAISQPYRLRVVKVRENDRAENLAGYMAIPSQPLERFLVLNGIDGNATLQAGAEVKVIAAR
ncbi:MAG: Zn-dependent protease, partial [Pseudomonadota bacterium]